MLPHQRLGQLAPCSCSRDPLPLDAHRDDKIWCIVPLHRRLHPHARCFQGHRRRLGPKTCPDDGTMAELACAQYLLQPCWLSAASAVDSTGLTQAEVGPQLQVNLPEPMCSGRAFVFRDSTCLCQARPKMCGSMPSEAQACCHTSRPRAWHRHAFIVISMKKESESRVHKCVQVSRTNVYKSDDLACGRGSRSGKSLHTAACGWSVESA